jgi:hypothetical protein
MFVGDVYFDYFKQCFQYFQYLNWHFFVKNTCLVVTWLYLPWFAYLVWHYRLI